MKFSANSGHPHGGPRTMVRCPQCGREAVFETIGQDLHVGESKLTGQRRCPNPSCRGHLFVVHADSSTALLASYPPITIDFDATSIPNRIKATFTEAINCHANECFVACAIMVRRTLEEICEDKKCVGNNLKERIAALGTKIVLPQELLDAMNELRLLGNDAAHVEATEYNKIGRPELETAIATTKEIMKAIYQYSSLLERLRALKKQPS